MIYGHISLSIFVQVLAQVGNSSGVDVYKSCTVVIVPKRTKRLKFFFVVMNEKYAFVLLDESGFSVALQRWTRPSGKGHSSGQL